MITIPEIVEEIVRSEPFLEEALSHGIINCSALARDFRPKIEERLLKRVETGAILMALRRLSLEKKLNSNLAQIFAKMPEMIVRSNLIEYTIENSASLLESIGHLLKQYPHPNSFFTTTQGVFETAIIMNEAWEATVKKELKKEKILVISKNLSAITIKLPKENVTTPGVYYVILKALAWENVNMIDVISTNTEFTIILEDREVDRAFSILKKVFKRNL